MSEKRSWAVLQVVRPLSAQLANCLLCGTAEKNNWDNHEKVFLVAFLSPKLGVPHMGGKANNTEVTVSEQNEFQCNKRLLQMVVALDSACISLLLALCLQIILLFGVPILLCYPLPLLVWQPHEQH